MYIPTEQQWALVLSTHLQLTKEGWELLPPLTTFTTSYLEALNDPDYTNAFDCDITAITPYDYAEGMYA